MERHVVVGTAGHVDHGKTALVKVLTGIDTDRWEEEKRRGITIDLGFAVLDLGCGLTASIVDVPGHEDFVRNMVAGATGIDLALLVVAADEGVMPQTSEHLAILEFLGVKAGVVAITKCDLVDGEWLDLVKQDLAERLTGSAVAWQSIVVCSAIDGRGIDELRDALSSAVGSIAVRSQEDLFRLPVDRVFSVAGAGTVVTGTTWTGTARVGDEVRVLPGDHRARVRGIEVHGHACDAAVPGRRTALALAGIGRRDLARGHVVVAGDHWRESHSVDVIITLLPASRPITQRSRVRFHVGTAEALARVTPLHSEIEPGSVGKARLRLETPLVCRWGDRAVIRSYSPVTTIGGCVVVDPWPPRRPRRPVRLDEKAALDATVRLDAFVDVAAEVGVSPADLPVRLGIVPGEVARAISSAAAVVPMSQRLLAPRVIDAARDATLGALAEYHRKKPLDLGMPRELLRQVVRDESLAEYVQRSLNEAGSVVIEGQTVRSASHRPVLTDEQAEAGRRVLAELRTAAGLGRTVTELGDTILGRAGRDLLEFYVRQGAIVRVGKDRYYDKVALDQIMQRILQEIDRLGRASPGQLRAETGLSRKYLIPLLEWMDVHSLTQRDGDTRGLGPAAVQVLNQVDSG